MIEAVQVLPLTKIVGWGTLVGGALAGTLATLLVLGPMLGFHDWYRQGPGPRTSGVVELPAAFVARPAARAAPLTGVGSVLPALVQGGDAAGPVLPSPPVGDRPANRGAGNDRPSRAPRTPAPQPTTTPVAPVSPPVVSVPVVQPVAPAPAAETTAGTRPGNGNNSFSADSSQASADAKKNADKHERKAAQHQGPTALAVPIADEEADDGKQDDQADEREHGQGQDNDQDLGRGYGHAKDNEFEKDKKH